MTRLGVLLAALLGGAALAATLQVTPLSLEIDLRRSKAGSVTVTNTGRDAARYRVTVLRVSQDGQETLQPAPEVVLNPCPPPSRRCCQPCWAWMCQCWWVRRATCPVRRATAPMVWTAK